VWSRGKDGDYIKVLPIAINVTGARVEERTARANAVLQNETIRTIAAEHNKTIDFTLSLSTRSHPNS
jgi:hypothetical protein